MLCLYDKVLRLCDKKKISIYKMCKDTGIQQNTVSNWKARKSITPSLENAVAMSKYFDVNIEFFLGSE